ncbi:MAG: glycerol-3-phosphate dehydrogenase [Rhodospirillaceae bacterium]|jgi:glycerol-3-phosphate dehydrogenase|nr:glycerol-3-phosphate dehydrogenase [Rhodospirillales bacterium]MBT3904336.1 glycerol-3-phosphate dehydrogenase [Rhodospirillaceae bacterium]MBT4703556.1 glycerol-3-phosphate dehydrogenase [Rhodospirillaceae bacterium]MBT5036701.1 glycerol-3-phosphate dehydrogenase [Rhodospirillaceae bacterium]MBT6220211.1 glycerol-3-phosphate dehydrogenase [Rhodospirillaceae bacterium]
MSARDEVDLLIIGGGINGVGIARDAAGRGLSVLLCEQGDLGGATSSASTKLIHGGLRYLEHYEFRLVRESLREREILLDLAPHIVRPMRFVLAHNKNQRPAWMIRIGLFIYDHLGGRKKLAGSHGISFRKHPSGRSLNTEFDKGFIYSDCCVDDARLVILNAMSAREIGAEILTHTKCTEAKRDNGQWQVTLSATSKHGADRDVTAKVLINAAGPWVGEVLNEPLSLQNPHSLRRVKGSHIVVPQLFDHEFAYIFQNPDNRIVFAIPYENNFTLIGTTDVDYDGDPMQAQASEEEVAYLCEAVSRYFKTPVKTTDVVWSYSGVRPLFGEVENEASGLSRDYLLDIDIENDVPVLSVFGGKITTYRKLAEQVLKKLRPWLPEQQPPWTEQGSLPGGDIENNHFEAFLNEILGQYPWMPTALLNRYARAYGTRIHKILNNASSLQDLGVHLGDLLYEAEVRYLSAEEWARTAEDILWRRTKLGLHVTPETVENLETWMTTHFENSTQGTTA